MLDLNQVSQSSLSEDGRGLEFTLPQVLISVALEDEQMLHTSDWVEWLKNFPAVAKSLHIQGVYKCNSTLVHLSLPVALWDVIPSNPAISFISFIKTHNLAPNRGLIYDPSKKRLKKRFAGKHIPIAHDSAGYYRGGTDLSRHRDPLPPPIKLSVDSALGLSPKYDTNIDVHVWDTAIGAVRGSLLGHTRGVKAVIFSPNGQLLASASSDHTVRLSNIAFKRDFGTGNILGERRTSVHSIDTKRLIEDIPQNSEGSSAPDKCIHGYDLNML